MSGTISTSSLDTATTGDQRAVGVPSYVELATWVGLNGPKPSSASLAAYLKSELDNCDEIDAVEVAVACEAIKALAIQDDIVSALRGIAKMPTWNECATAEPQIRQSKADISNELDRCINAARTLLIEAEGR